MYLPFLGGNYFILDIDPDYKWVVVGNPCRTNFWVLSKTPKMDDACLKERINFVRRLGFCT